MSVSKELLEKVFAPGDLVFGCNFDRLIPILETGIRPAIATGKIAKTPNSICFAMLSDISLPRRYALAKHFGPAGGVGVADVGIIVSREGLMHAFPNQVKAIGEIFWNWKGRYSDGRKHYSYNEKNQTVFGFPIAEYQPAFGFYPFVDEVRIFPHDPVKAVVGPVMWGGFTTWTPVTLSRLIEEAGLSIRIPIIAAHNLGLPAERHHLLEDVMMQSVMSRI